MKVKNRFARGTGCYVCRNCQKKTRSTGRGDNENCELCAECFDLASIDNSLTDNGLEGFNSYKDEVVQLFARRPDLKPLFPDLVEAVAAINAQ